jgi:hypothetical protein
MAGIVVISGAYDVQSSSSARSRVGVLCKCFLSCSVCRYVGNYVFCLQNVVLDLHAVRLFIDVIHYTDVMPMICMAPMR